MMSCLVSHCMLRDSSKGQLHNVRHLLSFVAPLWIKHSMLVIFHSEVLKRVPR